VCADEARYHPASVDVSNKNNGHIGCLSKTHIGYVILPKIDLCWTARPLDKDDFGLLREAIETVENGGHQCARSQSKVAAAYDAGSLALNNDL